VAQAVTFRDIRDRLVDLPFHHGGNGYMTRDLFTVRHEIIETLEPKPASVFEFGALTGYFLVTAVLAAPSIERVAWVDAELHTPGSNAMTWANLRAASFDGQLDFWTDRTQVPADLRFDLVQVDSDHSYDGCLADLRAAMLLEPSWLMVDDWTNESHQVEIKQACKDWLAEQEAAGVMWEGSQYETQNGLAMFTRATTSKGGTDG
jgi:hypothetical protein